ncbi:SDR family oxidoreductase [Algivirga pacifica]|uniref:SDR family oxidoreductase n=1 Tax=Algivirga pacifica TaxID=1162670 RepID=A0ABP9D0K0_9BACT
MRLKDKNYVVIGGSSGIGAALIKLLKADGGEVFNFSRSNPDIEGITHHSYDVQEDDFSSLTDKLPDAIHGVAYCPGTINLKPFIRLSTEDFEQDFSINVMGAVKVLQALHKPLKAAKGSSVVLFSTVAVQTGMAYHASVAASKGAIEGLARTLASEWASSHIRVNAIAPSLTDTPLAEGLLQSEEKKEAAGKRHPLGRVGTPQDIATAALYLLADYSSWVTGQVMAIDGGMGSLR